MVLGGLVPHILSPTSIKQFLPGPVLFPFLYLGKRNGEGVLSRRGNPEDPRLVGKGLA